MHDISKTYTLKILFNNSLFMQLTVKNLAFETVHEIIKPIQSKLNALKQEKLKKAWSEVSWLHHFLTKMYKIFTSFYITVLWWRYFQMDWLNKEWSREIWTVTSCRHWNNITEYFITSVQNCRWCSTKCVRMRLFPSKPKNKYNIAKSQSFTSNSAIKTSQQLKWATIHREFSAFVFSIQVHEFFLEAQSSQSFISTSLRPLALA